MCVCVRTRGFRRPRPPPSPSSPSPGAPRGRSGWSGGRAAPEMGLKTSGLKTSGRQSVPVLGSNIDTNTNDDVSSFGALLFCVASTGSSNTHLSIFAFLHLDTRSSCSDINFWAPQNEKNASCGKSSGQIGSGSCLSFSCDMCSQPLHHLFGEGGRTKGRGREICFPLGGITASARFGGRSQI